MNIVFLFSDDHAASAMGILVIRSSERPIWIGWPKKVIPLTTPIATARPARRLGCRC